MFGRIILILAICVLAQAVILPLKMENTSLVEQNNNKHLIKREVFSSLQSIIDAIVDFFRNAVVNLAGFGLNFQGFAKGMRSTFKNLLDIKD